MSGRSSAKAGAADAAWCRVLSLDTQEVPTHGDGNSNVVSNGDEAPKYRRDGLG